ncbi:VIT1/CCC1 family protein [Chloroflexota bacterium]
MRNMELKTPEPGIQKRLLKAQKNEITGHFIYENLSKSSKGSQNKRALQRISSEELKHHDICIKFSCQDIHPNRLKIWMYYLMSLVFGVMFSLKFMERAERREHVLYSELSETMPETIDIVRDEIRHEQQLLDLIDDERLNYSSDIVRGMNVAIVEITGALAGLTFAFQNSELVVETIIIIGIIMSLTVMSTEYLAAKTDSHVVNPLKSLLYAGIANLFTLCILLLPYMLFRNIYISLVLTIVVAVIIIYVFAFFISVVKGISIKKRFLEMLLISLGIAILAFGIGLLARFILHIDVV